MTHIQVNISVSPQPELGVLLLELGVGSVSQVSLVSHMVRVRAVLCMLLEIVFVMCVAPPTQVCVWSMAVLLGQLFEYYYYYYFIVSFMTVMTDSILSTRVCIFHFPLYSPFIFSVTIIK